MRKSLTTRRNLSITVFLLALCSASLACSSIQDVIGQQQRGGPTATVPVFATATPGGRISVWLTTPTGQAAEVAQPTGTVFGQVVAPVVTATAAYATMRAATAMAGATVSGPIFQPSDCPQVGGPPPPTKPASFSQYPEKISLYLSAGGPPTILEATLRSWGAVLENAAVQADTDLTGDGVPEIIVTLYDPTFYKQDVPSPGQLLVYGCSQKGYRLLYYTAYSPATIIPELKRVGDMNGDARAELAYTQQTCNGTQCSQVMQILSWNATLGGFVPLNNVPMNATNGKVIIADLDKDGILEVQIAFDPPADPVTGPPRRTSDIWDWDGVNYLLALTQSEPPIYRIHALYDADVHFNQGDWKGALKLYDRVRDDGSLQPWTPVPNEGPVLRAYATYKKELAFISEKIQRSADDSLTALQAENPAGTPGEVFATMGQTFMDSYKQTRDRKKACAAVLAFAASRPDALSTLNSYGSANRTYTLPDLCPFADK